MLLMLLRPSFKKPQRILSLTGSHVSDADQLGGIRVPRDYNPAAHMPR